MLAARKTNLITARARKKIRSARVLANARKDHSIPLVGNTVNSRYFGHSRYRDLASVLARVRNIRVRELKIL